MKLASRHIVIAVTGASGVALAEKCLELLSPLPDVTAHLVLTAAARLVVAHEMGSDGIERLEALCDVSHDPDEIGGILASGSFKTAGMLIAPCTLHTAMALAAGLGGNLVERAGQVHLKERRPLVILLRESPLATHHLEHLRTLSAAGAVIMPATPRFYFKPSSVDELLRDMASKALDAAGIQTVASREWSPS